MAINPIIHNDGGVNRFLDYLSTVPEFLKVEDDFSSITIGQYKISALHFGDFVYYVARGGFMGWFNQVMPSYAKETMKALKDTDNELFKYIRKELEDS